MLSKLSVLTSGSRKRGIHRVTRTAVVPEIYGRLYRRPATNIRKLLAPTRIAVGRKPETVARRSMRAVCRPTAGQIGDDVVAPGLRSNGTNRWTETTDADWPTDQLTGHNGSLSSVLLPLGLHSSLIWLAVVCALLLNFCPCHPHRQHLPLSLFCPRHLSSAHVTSVRGWED